MPHLHVSFLEALNMLAVLLLLVSAWRMLAARFAASDSPVAQAAGGAMGSML